MLNMATFCRYWRMTPPEYYALDPLEREAMLQVMDQEARAMQRAQAHRGRR
jgi:hypothetical protein